MTELELRTSEASVSTTASIGQNCKRRCFSQLQLYLPSSILATGDTPDTLNPIAKLRSFCLRQRSVGSEICDRFGRDRKGLAPGGHERELGSSTKGTEAAGPGLN